MNDPGLLILGLGNVICADDGAGAAAVARLTRAWALPADVTALDGGTLGLALLPHLERVRDAILVDAVRMEAAPGTLVRLEGDDVLPAALERLSPHQIGVADLLAALRWRGRMPARLVLLGVVPATLELGLGRSPAVEAALPALVARVAAEAAGLGYRLTPRNDDEMDAAGAGRQLDRILGL